MIDDEIKKDFVMNNTNSNNTGYQEDNTEGLPEYGNLIPLPSMGITYTGENHLKDTIVVRPFDWRDEDILTTQHYIDDGIILDKILDRVILDKTLKRTMLTPVDKETILYWLRSQEFGPIVELNFICPSCEKTNKVSWNLEELDQPRYQQEILDELINRNGEILIETPQSKIKILLKVPTLAEIDVFKKRIKSNKGSDEDRLSSEFIRLMISGILYEFDGRELVERNKEKIFKLLDDKRLRLRELKFIREKIELINLKYNTEKVVTCDHCGYIQEGVELRTMSKSFFWPE